MKKQKKRRVLILSLLITFSLNITAYAVLDDLSNIEKSYEEYQEEQVKLV